MFRTNVQNTAVDVAIIGGGLAGMATALRLQAAGLTTVVVEAHGHVGGCAGYWRRRGYSFDVGATTLVDFEAGGVGAEFLDAVGSPPIHGEALPGYRAWLPDRRVTLYRDRAAWSRERLAVFGADRRHLRFWALLDRLADVFWAASRRGVRLPMRHLVDLARNLESVGWRGVPLARYLDATLGETLERHGLSGDEALCGLLGMLVEDTVHTSVECAPLINAALGITIRGAGLTRHEGGMHGFWQELVAHYRQMGGQLRTGTRVRRVAGAPGAFAVHAVRSRGDAVTMARHVVLAIPAPSASTMCAGLPLARRLGPYLERDRDEMGGAVVVFLGVPDSEVAGERFTHHQLMDDYARPLGDGNNMFVSVSAAGDLRSAPAGRRAVMLSTHTDLRAWRDLDEQAHQERKQAVGDRLIGLARRVYPNLGAQADFMDVGTPRAFARFAFRPYGAVGGAHQHPRNTNQFAIPHDLGGRGLWMVGDSTWPGLGTVACVLGSRIVAEGLLKERRRRW